MATGTRSATQATQPSQPAQPAPPNFSVLNQYAKDLDPSSHEGAKLLREMTRARTSDDDRLVVTLDTAKEVQDHFMDEGDKFAWGQLVSAIPISYSVDAAGAITTTLGSIFHDELSLKNIQLQASMIFGNNTVPTDQAQIDTLTVPNTLIARQLTDNTDADQCRIYYQRIRAISIADNIQNTVDKDTLELLKQSESQYVWTTPSGERMRDGPTMLFVLLEAINPSTKVRTLALQSKIDTARVSDHGGDISNLLTHMESIRILSERKGAKIANYELRLFDSLLRDDRP
ncbi:MAG: hypothetical protein HKN43_13255, partial [Rhodothermales bacterium]|nr:hypothetical protein [Rhodothermales bacterium]